MIKALIIDDESLARKRIELLLEEYSNVNITGVFDNGNDAVKFINKEKPDLIYLDIEMRENNGFEVLDQIKKENYPFVIFVTAYNEFAIKAFEYSAIDYLLKPFKDSRFHKATQNAISTIYSSSRTKSREKLETLLNTFKTQNFEKPLKKFPIKSNGKVHLIDFNDIIYITASGYYCEIFTKEKKYLLRESLTNLINKFETDIFLRIHRSTIVNTDFIKELIYSNFGEMDVKMKDEKIYRVSKTYKKELLNKIGLD